MITPNYAPGAAFIAFRKPAALDRRAAAMSAAPVRPVRPRPW